MNAGAPLDPTVLIIFGCVYLGMMLGEIPGLALDRTGIALLGAIALIVGGKISPDAAWKAIDLPTVTLLFGLMVVSAQFRLGGFYAKVARSLGEAAGSPPMLLALLVAVAGVLSALLANDIVCLAMAPVLVEVCARRRLDPRPFLLALACASNAGSAATLIGNPQNMLIGQTLKMSFGGYLLDAAPPAILGLVAVWAIICLLQRGAWILEGDAPEPEPQEFNRWQTAKGIVVLLALVAAFLMTSWPRDLVALAAAGILLTSRRTASREMLALVDWQLLVLFMGLFIVNRGLADSGALDRALQSIRSAGIEPSHPGWLFGGVVILSNLVSNVPAVMLLLPIATHPMAGPILALASTLAGNLILVGSIANLIVVDKAATLGVQIGWKDHARIGVPVTVVTLALAAAWLWLRSI